MLPCQSSASGLDWWTRTLCRGLAGWQTPRSQRTSGWTGWRRPRAPGCWAGASWAPPHHSETLSPYSCWRPLSSPADVHGQTRNVRKKSDEEKWQKVISHAAWLLAAVEAAGLWERKRTSVLNFGPKQTETQVLILVRTAGQMPAAGGSHNTEQTH